jgi:hypothetical protein
VKYVLQITQSDAFYFTMQKIQEGIEQIVIKYLEEEYQNQFLTEIKKDEIISDISKMLGYEYRQDETKKGI